jgi:hypothetical protein
MKSALEAATAHIDNSSAKPATPATKAKMASRILKNAAEGVTDADKFCSSSPLKKVSAMRIEVVTA